MGRVKSRGPSALAVGPLDAISWPPSLPVVCPATPVLAGGSPGLTARVAPDFPLPPQPRNRARNNVAEASQQSRVMKTPMRERTELSDLADCLSQVILRSLSLVECFDKHFIGPRKSVAASRPRQSVAVLKGNSLVA